MDETVNTLQARQRHIMTVMYRCKPGSARHAKVRTMYDTLVKMLEHAAGADAHCSVVDPDLANLFSDWYKEVNAHRPRFHVTRADVQAWIVKESSPAMIELREEMWAAEEKLFETVH